MPESPYASRPWSSSYAEGVPPEIDVPSQTLPEMLADSVARYGKKTALEFFGAPTTYRELGDQVGRAAEGLRRLGVPPGDREDGRRAQQPDDAGRGDRRRGLDRRHGADDRHVKHVAHHAERDR